MRLIKTFILRLYVDTEAPERVCGDLQALPDAKAFPFVNEDALSKLLHRWTIDPTPDEGLDTPTNRESPENG